MFNRKRFIETYRPYRPVVSKSKWKVGESPQYSSSLNKKILVRATWAVYCM